MTIAEILNAAASGSGILSAAQFGDLTAEELRGRLKQLEAKAIEHDRLAAEHQNAARLCRVGARSIGAELGRRAA